jgi:hypothetical protein
VSVPRPKTRTFRFARRWSVVMEWLSYELAMPLVERTSTAKSRVLEHALGKGCLGLVIVPFRCPSGPWNLPDFSQPCATPPYVFCVPALVEVALSDRVAALYPSMLSRCFNLLCLDVRAKEALGGPSQLGPLLLHLENGPGEKVAVALVVCPPRCLEHIKRRLQSVFKAAAVTEFSRGAFPHPARVDALVALWDPASLPPDRRACASQGVLCALRDIWNGSMEWRAFWDYAVASAATHVLTGVDPAHLELIPTTGRDPSFPPGRVTVPYK